VTDEQPKRNRVEVAVGDVCITVESDTDPADALTGRALYLYRATLLDRPRPNAGGFGEACTSGSSQERDRFIQVTRFLIEELSRVFPRSHPRMTAADVLLRDVAIAEAAELLGIAKLTSLVREVLNNQEATMSDQNASFEDLRRAIVENTAVDNQLISKFEDLRTTVDNLPTDRPINEQEQAALNDAVAALQAQTAAAVGALQPAPGGGVSTDTGSTPSGTVPAGSTVTIPVPGDPGPNPSPQGGTIDTDDEHPVATGGVSPVLVDPQSSTPVSTADAPPAGTAAEVAADEQDETRNDGDVVEPAPPAEITESPADPAFPADATATVDDPQDAQPQPSDVQPTVTRDDQPAEPNWTNTPGDLGDVTTNTSDLPADQRTDFNRNEF